MIKQSNESTCKMPPNLIKSAQNLICCIGYALSKLAGGKFVAKDGAELCSSPEEHFLGKEKQVALQRSPNLIKSVQN